MEDMAIVFLIATVESVFSPFGTMVVPENLRAVRIPKLQPGFTSLIKYTLIQKTEMITIVSLGSRPCYGHSSL